MSKRDDLFVRWELGQTDAADELTLAEVLRDPVARRAFARNAQVAAALGAPQALAATEMKSLPPARSKAGRPRRSRSTPSPRWAIAAGVLLAIGTGALIALMQPRGAAPGTVDQPTIASHVSSGQPAAKPFALLESAGSARIHSADGRERIGRDGESLVPGERVQTGAGAAVIVLGERAARLELIPGSSLSLPSGGSDPGTATVRLVLDSGRVDADVAPRPAGSPLIIGSALGDAEVVGTRFTFGLDPNEDVARLAVMHGAVRLSTPTDAGILVGAGQAGLAGEGLASMVPAAPDADQALPAGARVLWRVTPTALAGWRGVAEDSAWRSVAARPGDQWCCAELRSPLARNGWTVAAGTWLRFRYHVERFTPGLALEVHLKPVDETNYAQRFVPDRSDGWHVAMLRVDGAFRHLALDGQPLPVGESIHGTVWCALRDEGTPASPARFWIRDAVVFTAP